MILIEIKLIFFFCNCRNLQEGSLEVDGRKSIVQRSPGKLRQLNTDTGLYVGELVYF